MPHHTDWDGQRGGAVLCEMSMCTFGWFAVGLSCGGWRRAPPSQGRGVARRRGRPRARQGGGNSRGGCIQTWPSRRDGSTCCASGKRAEESWGGSPCHSAVSSSALVSPGWHPEPLRPLPFCYVAPCRRTPHGRLCNPSVARFVHDPRRKAAPPSGRRLDPPDQCTCRLNVSIEAA